MKDSRLLDILKRFSIEEFRSFEKFLKSPFVKSRRNIKALLYYLKNFHPVYDSTQLEKKYAFKKLFPGETYTEKKIINLMSDLTKEAENFLKHDALDKDEIASLLYTSKGYYNKKLLNHSIRVLKAMEKKLQPGFSPSKDYFSQFRQLTFIKSTYYTEISDFEKMIECTKDYFESSAVQFIIDFAQIMSTKDSALHTFGINVENDFIKSIFKSFDIDKMFRLVEKSNFEHRDLIALHYFLIKTIEKPEEKSYYNKLKDLFYKNISNLNREEKYFIFSHLANYCEDEVKKKNDKFYKEALEVYKAMLANNAYSFSESENMQVLTFRNIVYYCNTVKDDKWFEYFIENYTDTLSKEYRDDMKNFSYANLYFLRKEYEKVIVSISKITYEFFLFKSDLKNLMLKAYFELNLFEQGFYMVDTYKHFLANTKEISKSFKEYYKNFVDKYLELLKIKSGQSKEDICFIKSRIESENRIVNKLWLLEKAEELIH